ncbi:MAG: SMC-Scp complex subunit ScpB, partial [Rhizomicrobium sp.]
MSGVARLVAKIETEMGVEVENGETETPAEALGVNPEHLRMTEALLFAAAEPLDSKALSTSLPEGSDVAGLLSELQRTYEGRGVNLVCVAGKWQFRTAPDLAFL